MRQAVTVQAEILRSLTEGDLAELEHERPSQVSAIKRLSERHHALAKCLAQGMGNWEAAIACSYSPSRVSILLADPTFQNLIAFYREHLDAVYFDMHKALAGLTQDAIDEYRNRLEDNPEKVRTEQLIETIRLGADRTGYGPSTTNVNVQMDLSARLAQARKRVAEKGFTVIDGAVQEAAKTDREAILDDEE